MWKAEHFSKITSLKLVFYLAIVFFLLCSCQGGSGGGGGGGSGSGGGGGSAPQEVVDLSYINSICVCPGDIGRLLDPCPQSPTTGDFVILVGRCTAENARFIDPITLGEVCTVFVKSSNTAILTVHPTTINIPKDSPELYLRFNTSTNGLGPLILEVIDSASGFVFARRNAEVSNNCPSS